MGIWKISLPGHWLHVGRGILNTSPVYFFALFGLLTLGKLRDRRVVIAAALYAATAGINGLHDNWLFGHDLPGRFMMTALPVLAMGLAWGLPRLMLKRDDQSSLGVRPGDQSRKRSSHRPAARSRLYGQ